MPIPTYRRRSRPLVTYANLTRYLTNLGGGIATGRNDLSLKMALRCQT